MIRPSREPRPKGEKKTFHDEKQRWFTCLWTASISNTSNVDSQSYFTSSGENGKVLFLFQNDSKNQMLQYLWLDVAMLTPSFKRTGLVVITMHHVVKQTVVDRELMSRPKTLNKHEWWSHWNKHRLMPNPITTIPNFPHDALIIPYSKASQGRKHGKMPTSIHCGFKPVHILVQCLLLL